jgi:hypothetical protein
VIAFALRSIPHWNQSPSPPKPDPSLVLPFGSSRCDGGKGFSLNKVSVADQNSNRHVGEADQVPSDWTCDVLGWVSPGSTGRWRGDRLKQGASSDAEDSARAVTDPTSSSFAPGVFVTGASFWQRGLDRHSKRALYADENGTGAISLLSACLRFERRRIVRNRY